MVGGEQASDCDLVECRTEISVLRERIGALSSYCKKQNKSIPRCVANFLDSLRGSLAKMFNLLPPCRLYVTNYHNLAHGINWFRATGTIDCSTGVIVRCVCFVCVFVEEDFTKLKFYRLIDDFDPEKDVKLFNKSEK